MRVNGSPATTGAAARSESRGGSFGDAMRRVRRGGDDGPARGGRALRAERSEQGARSARVGRRPSATGAPLAVAAAATVAPAGIPTGDATPALASVLRAVPVLVAAARAAAGAQLALSFGSALDVELRSGPAGVDLVLSPAAALLGAARAELPRLVAALRAQGIRVGRAEIRVRRDAPPGRGAR